MRNALVTLCLVTLISLGCKKNARVVVVPTACFTVDNNTVQVGDTITFADCSVAKDVQLTIRLPNQLAGPAFRFESNNTYSTSLNVEGVYEARLMASNQNEAPIAVQVDTITVLP